MNLRKVLGVSPDLRHSENRESLILIHQIDFLNSNIRLKVFNSLNKTFFLFFLSKKKLFLISLN